jgi:hypothetical protein
MPSVARSTGSHVELLSGAGYWPVCAVSVITGMRPGTGTPDGRFLISRHSRAGYCITGQNWHCCSQKGADCVAVHVYVEHGCAMYITDTDQCLQCFAGVYEHVGI